MGIIKETLLRLDSNQNLGYSLIRIFLGMALFIRGWIFVTDPGAVVELARQETLHMWFSYVTWGHLLGGALMMVGIQTRLAALFQIPILVGAIFIVHTDHTLAMESQSFELAIMVLVLLIVFGLFGSGPISLNKYLAGKRSKFKENPQNIVAPS